MYSTSGSLLYRIRKDGRYFLLKRSAISGSRGRKILRREYELSIGVTHPNIINVYEYRLNSSGQHEIVMEYVEGRTLDEFLKESPSQKTKKRIFEELLDAVAYLHQRRIIHNDLKPANILVSRNGDHIKLIDFGLCDDDAHYEIKTPGYSEGFAAPELKGDRKSDERSDIYSLGIIMRLIFGKSYGGVVRKCLKENPAKRFSDLTTLKKRWKREEMKWPLGVALIIVGLIVFGVISLIKENNSQRKKIDEFETAIIRQTNELTVQNDSGELKQVEIADSKDISRKIEPEREIQFIEKPVNSDNKANNEKDDKQLIIIEFRKTINKLSTLALDSMKQCKDIKEVNRVFLNYSLKVKDIYENRIENISDEKTKEELMGILLKESASFDKQYNFYMKKVTEQVTNEIYKEWEEKGLY